MIKSVNLLGLSIDDFQKIIKEAVASEMQRLEKDNLQSKKEDKEFLTRKEAKAFLDVSATTLWSYGKKKLITPRNLGGRVYYSKNELLNLLNDVV